MGLSSASYGTPGRPLCLRERDFALGRGAPDQDRHGGGTALLGLAVGLLPFADGVRGRLEAERLRSRQRLGLVQRQPSGTLSPSLQIVASPLAGFERAIV